MDETELDEEIHCHACGLIVRDGTKVSVAMQWHMAHSLSEEFTADFLKLRCRALQEAFGDLKGVQGMFKNVRTNRFGKIAMDPTGAPIVFGEKIVHRPKKCEVVMGFVWPNVDDDRWPILKERFKEIFDPATLHGEADCNESDNAFQISSYFELAEKGGD